LNKEEVIKNYNLQKEEIKKIDIYIRELKKHNATTNLVGASTLLNPWERHICDSLQIMSVIKNKNKTILDMGTGAGLPGVVLSIIGYNHVTMVDSKIKKTNFVEHALKLLNLKGAVVNSRLENLKKQNFDYITSRALSSLNNLFNYSLLFSNKNTTLVFLKGRNVNNEIIEAKKNFSFDFKIFKSKTSGDGNLITINKLKKDV